MYCLMLWWYVMNTKFPTLGDKILLEKGGKQIIELDEYIQIFIYF